MSEHTFISSALSVRAHLYIARRVCQCTPIYRAQGLRTSVCGKMFATLDTLLAWLSEKIPMQSGVQHVFSLPDGTEMRDVTRFVGGTHDVIEMYIRFIEAI